MLTPITICEIPKPDDELTIQYYDRVEIRANMNGFAGTGTLIAYQDYRNGNRVESEDMEALLNRLQEQG